MIFGQIDANDVNLPMVNEEDVDPTTIINFVLSIVVGLSIIGIILSGIRYTISNGNPQDVARAKSALIYSIVGLVVSVFAIAITQFVIGRFVQ